VHKFYHSIGSQNCAICRKNFWASCDNAQKTPISALILLLAEKLKIGYNKYIERNKKSSEIKKKKIKKSA